MTKQYLWLKQHEGCDYTVGCGERLVALGERSLADVLDYYGALECDEIDEAYLVTVDKFEDLNLEGMRRMKQAAEDLAAQDAAEAAEYEEYKRLHAKWGDK